MTALSVFTKRMGRAIGTGLGTGSLAPEIVLVGSCESCMGVGGADHAEFIGVNAEFLFDLQPISRAERAYSKCSMSFVVSSLRSRLPLSHFERGEFVIRREERVRLPVSLDLRGFVEWFPAGSIHGVVPIDGLPVNVSMRGNMRPLLRLPLCARVSTLPPDFSS